MKVLFVSHSSQLYGSERSLLTLVLGLKETGRITPIVLLPRDGPFRRLLAEARIPVVVSGYVRWIHHGNLLAAFYHTVRNLIAISGIGGIVRQIEPDLIYSNSLTNGFGAMVALRHRVPHVWHVREFIHEDLGARLDWGMALTARLIRRSTSRMICNSHAVCEKWRNKIKKDMFEVVYNGFDFVEPLGMVADLDEVRRSVREGGRVQFLIAGSIHPGKGTADALGAAAILIHRGRPVELMIAGAEEHRAYVRSVRAMSLKLGISARVHWYGFVEDLPMLIRRSFAVLLCSRSEAFGRVAVEAMGQGVPVVAARAGGLKEIIQHEVTGLLYRPGDVEGLAHCLERLLGDEGLYNEISERGKAYALSTFPSRTYVSRILGILENMQSISRIPIDV